MSWINLDKIRKMLYKNFRGLKISKKIERPEAQEGLDFGRLPAGGG